MSGLVTGLAGLISVLAWRPVTALYRAASLPLPQPFHSSLLTLFPALI